MTLRRLPILLVLMLMLTSCAPPLPRVLVFSKTNGYRHASIEVGTAAIKQLGNEHGFEVVATEDSTVFNDTELASYAAVLFLSTTGDIVGESGKVAMQRFIEAGGGYVGVHSASDTEYGWPWYGQLVGGYFMSHPKIQEAELEVTDQGHPSTAHLPDVWTRTDEWYEIRTVAADRNVLLQIREDSYERNLPRSDGGVRPMAWYKAFDGGRSFYTALGHTDESYAEPAFLQHLLGGIQYAIGDEPLDYASAGVRPLDAEFRRSVLDENLNEPMEIAVLSGNRVLFIERSGALLLNDGGVTRVVDTLDVFYGLEDGLLGLTVDPDWETNHWIYVYYSAPGTVPHQRLSRFAFDGESLDPDSEHQLLIVPNQRKECCHSGGSLAFGPDRTLFLSVGDNTNPFASEGFSPTDERAGRAFWDAQRTAANTRDLRGKILRIRVTHEGEAEIPAGNLFEEGGGRPEIYVMGDRNPFRISVDPANGWLYWGEIGPDATDDDPDRGPRGYDEINQARAPGFFGWPYFIADNQAYRRFDFATRKPGAARDPAAPANLSPNNTGSRTLPPAQPAFMWYPYGPSDAFPAVGVGGRSAMAGPVYHRGVDQTAGFPAYYEDRLFVYEWMRNTLFTVALDANGDYRWMEPFLAAGPWSRPMDMAFSDDGALYVLEYGQVWNARNPDARLVRIDYNKS